MKHQSYYSDRINEYPDSFVSAMENAQDNVPVIPLPNPGEGMMPENGNMGNGGMGNNSMGGGMDMNAPSTSVPSGGANESEGAEPVIPLPNPGEGGPVYSPPGWDIGNESQGTGNRPSQSTPSIPGRPSQSTPSTPSRPTTSFPPIFRPIFSGGANGVIGSVTVIPGISFPCFNCTATSFSRVRFLNAASGYRPFNVYLGNWLVANQLDNGDITSYVQSASGSQTVTVSGSNGYIYIQKEIQVRSSTPLTIAIINTPSGLDLMEISDFSCLAPSGASCLRACNLSVDLGPFDVSIENRSGSYTAFSNVRYREVTPYTSFSPGWYQFYISRSTALPSTAVATAAGNMNANTSYTLYIFNAPTAAEGLRTMIVPN